MAKIIKKINIPHALIIYLERLNYEVDSYQSLLIYAINHNLYNTKNFNQYRQDYLEKFAEYEILKQQIINMFMPKKYQNNKWEIHYQEEILYIYEGEGK